MSNDGPNTNGSRFFITFGETPNLDGKHVVFGHISKGTNVLDKIEEKGSESGAVSAKIVIANCGEVK